MAPRKQQVAGGFVGILCISAIVLAIVFGIMWGQCKDDKKKVKSMTCTQLGCLQPDACVNDYKEGTREGCYNGCMGGLEGDGWISGTNPKAAAETSCNKICNNNADLSVDTTYTCNNRCNAEIDGSGKSKQECRNNCNNNNKFRKCMNDKTVTNGISGYTYTISHCQQNYPFRN
jgi:hypothetical protein